MHPTSIETRLLYWTCSDETNLVSAVVKQTLDAWQAGSQTYHQRTSFEQLHESSQIGLAVWAINSPSQISATCLAIEKQRRIHPQLFLLVYLAIDLSDARGLLIEAGAHYVVQQLCQLQLVLDRSASRLRVDQVGHHPLTSGLISRLPWS